MEKSILFAGIIGASVYASIGFAGSGSSQWGYSGESGPQHWGSLHAKFSACSQGKHQSPVDIHNAIEGHLAPINFDYKAGGFETVNNGHTIQVNYERGSSIEVDGETFNLLQYHFHSPSENQINGVVYPMEAHFVHADREGNLAVVGIMFVQGKHNDELEKAWKHMPKHAGTKDRMSKTSSAEKMLPIERDYYRFSGSLTTPPCTEGVRWMMMKQPVEASKKQIQRFRNVLKEPNNRPVQPLNARFIVG